MDTPGALCASLTPIYFLSERSKPFTAVTPARITAGSELLRGFVSFAFATVPTLLMNPVFEVVVAFTVIVGKVAPEAI